MTTPCLFCRPHNVPAVSKTTRDHHWPCCQYHTAVAACVGCFPRLFSSGRVLRPEDGLDMYRDVKREDVA